ncbi:MULTISPECIES: sulfatase [unclassified Lentimonas]|uniref:sulfatase n=1 Tax=unclassified Lentimonas TaxID=2630993 RepID=UPI00138A3ADB|nr:MULTISPECIES: sulfatase [unclassified Lentimonas]
MKKNIILSAMFLAGMSAWAEKPNILLIMVDDLNTSVGCYDGPAITPNIDSLAGSGIKFSNAYAACPSCNPSRVAMMVGQRPENSGVFNNTQHFRETAPAMDLTTLPQVLMANGYNTIAAGKIFHNRSGSRAEVNPLSDPQSWTYQPGINAGKSFGHDFKNRFHQPNGLPKWVLNTRVDVDPKDKKKLKSTWVWGPLEDDIAPEDTLDWKVAKWGADWLNKDMSDPMVQASPSPDEKPWLLACGIFRPHIPLICPKEFFDLYTTDEHKHRLELPDIPSNDIDDLPAASGTGKDWFVKYVKPWPEEWKALRHAYYACTTYADAAVGILLDGLEKSGYADNTIVILMGDHGYHLGEKDRLGKSKVWRGASSMPMIIRMPNGKIGTAEAAVSMLDLYPTIMELLALKAPQQLDGTSLVPLLTAPDTPREAPAVITDTSGKQIGVVLDQWHYISYSDGSEELYDHSIDQAEIINLMHPDNYLEKYRVEADRLKQFIPSNRAGM